MQFRDLQRQYTKLKTQIDAGMEEVISCANFISGKQTGDLEERLAAYAGTRHCITCGNGTDAISIALLAWEIGSGDAVFVPDFTFFSSAECPAAAGATPVFVDVRPDTYNLDAEKLEEAVNRVLAEGKLNPKAVIAVDLFGLPAEYGAIRNVCTKYNLLLLEDGAQGFGGRIGKQRACSFGDISTTSFFPAKPLGCYGDGGAVFTSDDGLAELIRSICVHGKNKDDKYDNVRLGRNSRLDTLQAAVLLVKLKAFQDYELAAVNQAADFYAQLLDGIPGLAKPFVPEGYYSSWAQYTVQLPEGVSRIEVMTFLKEHSIPVMVYYTRPMHRQKAFQDTDSEKAFCPVTEKLCSSVICLPMHPYLKEDEIRKVADTLLDALKDQNAV